MTAVRCYTSSEGPKMDAGWIYLQYFHTGGENKEINDIFT